MGDENWAEDREKLKDEEFDSLKENSEGETLEWCVNGPREENKSGKGGQEEADEGSMMTQMIKGAKEWRCTGSFS